MSLNLRSSFQIEHLGEDRYKEHAVKFQNSNSGASQSKVRHLEILVYIRETFKLCGNMYTERVGFKGFSLNYRHVGRIFQNIHQQKIKTKLMVSISNTIVNHQLIKSITKCLC